MAMKRSSYRVRKFTSRNRLDYLVYLMSLGKYGKGKGPTPPTPPNTYAMQTGQYALDGAALQFAIPSSAFATGDYVFEGSDVVCSMYLGVAMERGDYEYGGPDAHYDPPFTRMLDFGNYDYSGSTLGLGATTGEYATGDYVLDGADVTKTLSRVVRMATGEYVLSGANAYYDPPFVRELDGGEYVLSGADISYTIMQAVGVRIARYHELIIYTPPPPPGAVKVARVHELLIYRL